MIRFTIPALVISALPLMADAQTQVVTTPSPLFTTPASGTVAATNTFQSLFSAPTPPAKRSGCLVVNNSIHQMWIFVGAIANATQATAVPLQPATTVSTLGGTFNCATLAGGVVQDQISIEGTQNDTFVALQQ